MPADYKSLETRGHDSESDQDLAVDSDDDAVVSESDIARIRAIWAAITTVFIDSIMYSIILPSLAIYLQSFVDETEASYATWLGFITAAHPTGQLIGSPFAAKYFVMRSAKETMCVFISIFCIGACVYSVSSSATMLLTSRFIQGFGDANLVVCRAYVGHSAKATEKVKFMSYTSAAQGLGFLAGSLIGGTLSAFDTTIAGLAFNGNTAPGYFSALMGLLNICACAYYMRDFAVDVDGSDNKKSSDGGAVEAKIRPDVTAIVVCNIVFFLTISSFSVILGLITVYLNINYGWGTGTISLVFAMGSILGVISFGFVKKANMKYNERYLMIAGLLCGGIGQWAMGGFGLFFAPIEFWFVGTCVFFLSHPFAMACSLSLYAKVIGPFKGDQGPYMGYITMMGSAASIIAPLWSAPTLAAEDYTGEVTFFCSGCFMYLGVPLVFYFWKKLIPHPDTKKAGIKLAPGEDGASTNLELNNQSIN